MIHADFLTDDSYDGSDNDDGDDDDGDNDNDDDDDDDDDASSLFFSCQHRFGFYFDPYHLLPEPGVILWLLIR